jgi:hypothetical protein
VGLALEQHAAADGDSARVRDEQMQVLAPHTIAVGACNLNWALCVAARSQTKKKCQCCEQLSGTGPAPLPYARCIVRNALRSSRVVLPAARAAQRRKRREVANAAEQNTVACAKEMHKEKSDEGN